MAKQKSERVEKTNNQFSLIRGTIVIGLVAAFLAVLDTPLRSLITERLGFSGSSSLDKYAPGNQSGVCQQKPKLSPKDTKIEQFIRAKVGSPEYHKEIINKLSEIIRIRSESYDDLGLIGEDHWWDVFYQIEDYIKAKYPKVLEHVKLDHANTHGLILTWEGSVPAQEAKPILMLAHQDVVPVIADTVQDWTHPPYEGYYDGEIIWGRGATDDKGYLISIIESLDLLI